MALVCSTDIAFLFFLCCVLSGSSSAFTAPRSGVQHGVLAATAAAATTTSRGATHGLRCSAQSENVVADDDDDDDDEHPAVLGWPEKYEALGGVVVEQPPGGTTARGPRIIRNGFDVHAATETELSDLDVKHWPTWTTGDKPKWDVGNLVADKEMPYGELSYMVTGKLEITATSSEGTTTVVVGAGDLVTFPRGFVASWKILEELTWHYYLY